MSAAFHEFVSKLYGNEDRSDCTILFCCPRGITPREVDGPADGQRHQSVSKRQRMELNEDDARPAAAGVTQDCDEHPLPAHLLVICGGSPLLCAQAERWTTEQQQGPRGSSKPVLRIALDSADDLPFARSAIRFTYTGEVDVNGVTDLLSVRRLGEYLHVVGCEEACAAALVTLIACPKKGGGALSGVAEVFLHRAVFEDYCSMDSALAQSVMHECRKQLVKHIYEVKPKEPIAPGGPGLGEALAWAFLDAPSLLSDPVMFEQLRYLPDAAVEALLSCDSFATDDEASVLLLLKTWEYDGIDVSENICQKLCKMIRLSQLSATYLHVVLPHLSWFQIDSSERHFLCSYLRASPEKREELRLTLSEFDLSCPWYAPAPRPGYGTRRVMSYDWQVSSERLVVAATGHNVFATFKGGASGVICQGFRWKVSVTYDQGQGTAGVYLWCTCPSALVLPKERELVDAVYPGRAELIVYRRQEDGSQAVAWSMSYEEKWVMISRQRGEEKALELLPLSDGPAPPGAEGAVARQWAQHLHEGKVRGVLRWY